MSSRAFRISKLSCIRLFALALTGVISSAASAQLLNPPPGPIAPTMKRLDQLDARRVINTLPGSADAMHVITEPGQYVMTGDISCPSGKSGVVVVMGLPGGSVSIEMEGFSITGASGAISGIAMSSGGSLEVYGTKKGYDYYMAKSNISGFQTGIATGIAGGAVAGIVVAACVITDCGQGCVHLHAQNVVHRDIACRGISASDALHVELEEVQFSSGPRQTTSMDGTRCVVDGATGRGLYVSTASGGSLITIRGSSFSNTGASGVQVRSTAPPAGGQGSPVSVLAEDCRVSSCGGFGMEIQGPSGAVASSGETSVKFIRVELKQCASGGASFEECDSAVLSEMSISGCGGPALKARKVPKFKAGADLAKSVVSSCAGGLDAEDCDDLELSSFAFSDISGDAVSCTRSASGLSTGKVSLSDLSITRRASAPGGPSGRGVVVSDCASASGVRIAVGDVDGDGCDFRRVRDVVLNEISVTKTQDSASPALHGIVFTDCDNTRCRSVSVSRCSGDGVRYAWTQAGSSLSSKLIAHELTHVVQQGGAGMRVVCPSSQCSVVSTLDRCAFVSNGDDGCVMTCPSTQCSLSVSCSDSSFQSNGATGLHLTAQPQGSVTVSLSSCRCSSNGADGCAVVSATPGVSLRGGGTLYCWGTSCTSNGGSGMVSENPLYADKCTFSQNALYGASCVAPDPFTLTATLTDSVLQGNGGSCLKVAKGRYANARCEISDGLSHGVESSEGCGLFTDCHIQRCAGDGLHMTSATLTIQGGALRRNLGWGGTCSGGSCVVSGCTVELNGSSGGTPGAPVGGGLRFIDCTDVSLDRCVVSQNTGHGVAISSVAEMASCSSSDCKFTSNTGHGLALDNCPADVSRCISSSNGLVGVALSASCSRGRVVQCVCNDNGNGGLRVLGTRMVISGNSATASPVSFAFEISGGNAACPVVDSSQGLSACGPTDNVVH